MTDIEPPDITARELLTCADGIIQWACDTNAGDAWRAAAKTWTDLHARFAPVLEDAYEEGFSAGAESVGTVAGELHADFGLTEEQEIRARALDAAARFLGPGMATIDDATDIDHSELWMEVAADAARYIATGEITVHAEPAPPLEGGEAAEEEAT